MVFIYHFGDETNEINEKQCTLHINHQTQCFLEAGMTGSAHYS